MRTIFYHFGVYCMISYHFLFVHSCFVYLFHLWDIFLFVQFFLV
jgi:hypothetical protein